MKLAAQLYTIHDYTKNERDIETSLRKIRDIGYRAVQISAFGEYRTPWLAGLLAELGLEVCVTHMPYARIVGDTDALIEEHRLLGCDTIGLGSLPSYERADVLRTFEELAPAIDKIHAAGMHFVFHNHWKEFLCGPDGKNIFDLYCERFGADRAGILMDFYWLVYACQKPMETIDRYRDRLGIVHFKDMTMNERGERIFTEIYNGCIDYTAIFRKLEEVGGKWVAVEEDVCPCGDPFRALAISLENIKAHGLPFENL